MTLFDSDNLDEARQLLELQWQFRANRVLAAAHQLGIFVALKEPGSAAAVAEKCATDAAMTEKLLIACCALKLVGRNGDKFFLTQLGRDTMLPESLRYMGGVLDHGESLWWQWTGLADAVRTGDWSAAPEPPEPFASDWHEHFIRAMHGIAANGPGQWLAEQVDLSSRKRLLDVGGGPGTNSIALCQRFPDLKAVIWDLPQTLVIAREVIKRFGLQERISVEEGDWNRDDFGSGYDCLLMSNILHGAGEGALMKLKKAEAALEPGGLLMVNDFLLDDEGCGPLPAALFNIMVGAYPVTEMLDVITRAGFKEASLVARDGQRGNGLVTARRP